MVTKRSWYDGWFYALFIDNRGSILRRKIVKSVESGHTVLDIGCGTCGLTLDLADKSDYVLGTDISGRQINVARQRKKKTGLNNVDFSQINARELSGEIDRTFDYTILVFMIHEIDPVDRVVVLNEIKKCTRKLIILDYTSTIPMNLSGMVIRLIEFFAGREHYKNFLNYMDNGGMTPLLMQTGFVIKSEKVDRTGIFRMIIAETQN